MTTMTNHDPRYAYDRTTRLGNLGERIFMDVLTKSNACVVDEQTDIKIQYQGIDHVVEIVFDIYLEKFIGKRIFTTDVKYDKKSSETGNIVYELKSSKNSVGWFYKENVDTFTHVLPDKGEMIIVKAPEMRKYYAENKDDKDIFIHPLGHDGPTRSGNLKRTILTCIPIKILKEQDFTLTTKFDKEKYNGKSRS